MGDVGLEENRNGFHLTQCMQLQGHHLQWFLLTQPPYQQPLTQVSRSLLWQYHGLQMPSNKSSQSLSSTSNYFTSLDYHLCHFNGFSFISLGDSVDSTHTSQWFSWHSGLSTFWKIKKLFKTGQWRRAIRHDPSLNKIPLARRGLNMQKLLNARWGQILRNKKNQDGHVCLKKYFM